jgi:hypothetical protein
MGRSAIASGNYSLAAGYCVAAGPANHTITLGHGTGGPFWLENNIEGSLMVGFGTAVPTLFVGGSEDRVGMGTSNPLAMLHIVGDDTLGSLLIAPNETGSGDRAELILAEDDEGEFAMKLVYDGGANALEIYGKSGSTLDGPHVTIGRDNGRVGLGVVSPQRTLHVSDAIRLEPQSSAPTAPSMGDMYVRSSDGKLMVYDGTTWRACW